MPTIATAIPTTSIAVERAKGEGGSAKGSSISDLGLGLSFGLGASMYALRKLKKTDHFLKKRDFL